MSRIVARRLYLMSGKAVLRPTEDGAFANASCLCSCMKRHARPVFNLSCCNRPSKFKCSSTKHGIMALQRKTSATSSWSELIQSISQMDVTSQQDLSPESDIDKVKERLKQALAARRSHEQGNLLPHVIAAEICRLYISLESQDDKFSFFNLLSSTLDVDHDSVLLAVSQFNQSMLRDDATYLKAKERLARNLEPPYKHLLKDVGHLEEGVKTLVNMRKDILDMFSKRSMPAVMPHMHSFERHLKQHLAQWFSAGFLDLERVTWSSPASVLEKIMNYEQVHPTRGWDDFKRRLDNDRRCFIFTHRLLPGEPLVILHCALGDHLRTNMEGIHVASKSSLQNVTAGTFYTISSTQRGLSGIDLGNYLIKVAAQELKKEFPTINELGTLSPIPGFAKWLTLKLKSDKEYISEVWKESLIIESTPLNHESFENWLQNFKERKQLDTTCKNYEAYKQFLMTLCARYLYSEKRRGFALDPVANFHLRNGAILWRLNWLADDSVRGINRSFAIMVNYKYDLSQIEQNNKQYVVDGKIAASDKVLHFICANHMGS
eukprot:gene358-991_t